MSSMMTDEGVLHYEVDGRGEPLVLLHCWLGSWNFWREPMEFLASRRPYRIYALDFWGFGESDKRKDTYTIADYVSMVEQFMERMGIERAPIFGHSMGGTVAMSLALKKPRRVKKVAVVGSPMVGDSLSFLLKLAGYRWVAHILWEIPPLLNFVLWGYSPWIARDRKNIFTQMMVSVSHATVDSFRRSIADLRRIDLRPHLSRLAVPALGIFGLGDWVVDPRQGRVMAELIPDVRVEMMPKARHFPMLDDPQRFNQVLLDFLSEG